MPLATSTTVSGFDVGQPTVASRAPSAFAEFAQPRPNAPKFEQGHGVVIAGSSPSPAHVLVIAVFCSQ